MVLAGDLVPAGTTLVTPVLKISFNILQTYLIRSVHYHASTFKTFTLSFDVMNFQTSISKLKNSNSA